MDPTTPYIHQESILPEEESTENEQNSPLIIFGDVCLTVVAVAAAIVSLVGMLCLFGSLLMLCFKLSIAIKITLALVGAALSITALYLRNRYILVVERA